jgi:hypothetical protein
LDRASSSAAKNFHTRSRRMRTGENQHRGSAVEYRIQGAASADRGQSTSTAAGSATAVGPIPKCQLRILWNAEWINPTGAGSRMHTLDDGRPDARTRKGDKARLGGYQCASFNGLLLYVLLPLHGNVGQPQDYFRPSVPSAPLADWLVATEGLKLNNGCGEHRDLPNAGESV